MTGAAQQTTALARLVAGTALLPVTVAVGSGRRAWASVQATRKAIRQGARRVRPGRRRRRRGRDPRHGRRRVAGYVLAARAGRQRYQELTESARRVRQRPEVKRATEQAVAKLDQLSGQAADKLQAARQQSRQRRWAADRCGAGNANGDPPSPAVMPPADLAPMPAEPTVLPGQDASAAEEHQRPAPPDPLP